MAFIKPLPVLGLNPDIRTKGTKTRARLITKIANSITWQCWTLLLRFHPASNQPIVIAMMPEPTFIKHAIIKPIKNTSEQKDRF